MEMTQKEELEFILSHHGWFTSYTNERGVLVLDSWWPKALGNNAHTSLLNLAAELGSRAAYALIG